MLSDVFKVPVGDESKKYSSGLTAGIQRQIVYIERPLFNESPKHTEAHHAHFYRGLYFSKAWISPRRKPEVLHNTDLSKQLLASSSSNASLNDQVVIWISRMRNYLEYWHVREHETHDTRDKNLLTVDTKLEQKVIYNNPRYPNV